MFPGAVPGSLSEVKPYSNISVSLKDLEEWKK